MTTAERILNEARELSRDEIAGIVQALVQQLAQPPEEKPYSLLDFDGIAAHLADDEDPLVYLRRLRDEWDRPYDP